MTKEERREYNRAWWKEAKKDPIWAAKRKQIMDNGNLKHNYGITMAEFQSKLAAQGGVCAICGRPPSCQIRRFSMDHNHKTGQLRGILCGWCNRIIVPLMEDYRWILKPAAKYYKKYA